MSLGDRFRRAVRKSDSSDDASQAHSSAATSTTNASETSSLHTTATAGSTFSKVFPFRSRSRSGSRQKSAEKESGRARGKDRKKPIHPSQRPLTLQNLQHQEMLSQFTMTFGASDPSQIERLSFCGVSPCCTRPSSIDLDRDEFNLSSRTSALSLVEAPSGDSVRQ
ncbi:hypothetical protein DCS_05310 [Drechmeria coniospora]|uniref:Uncharacterized protein n=1 Tax=Drechmeria coniospora TaxID=98403 RepID=A0A151GMG1_DRECN|nr:hypothetical protein DCS_05310 [Drechmeria coniospora]KYK58297.1 hypothetical protein DCS_05310 [Drechmeria coniospora]ODA82866.1 hypothetical protein RJ55_01375 [Drechmeria coniospora]